MTNVDAAGGAVRPGLVLAAIILVVDAVQWWVLEAVVAAAWTDPPYGYARNFVSDLGALGIVSQGLLNVSAGTAGLAERAGVYSWLLWSVVTGVALISARRAPRVAAA